MPAHDLPPPPDGGTTAAATAADAPGALAAVSVRALCAFAARRGDLDLRFTPAPSAQQGIDGHLRVQGRRGAAYQPEVALRCERAGLRVRGRADGFDPERRRVEEIKTHRGAVESVRENQRALHWAQAKVYAAMLCERHGFDAMEVALVYLDLDSDDEHVLVERIDAATLEAHLVDLCERYRDWALREQAHHALLAPGLAALPFPRERFRPGQRELASHVYEAARSGRCLLAEAPTGIGKTLASLFPLLKCQGVAGNAGNGSAAEGSRRMPPLHKIFFLTAKTPGRAVALDALRQLRAGAPGLRVLEIASRDSVCEHPGQACAGDSCPLARGFYDRLGAAREAAAHAGWLDRAALRALAREHAVCPYFLAQEMVRWSQVVVADFNHYFDTSAFLFAMMREEQWQAAVLVDEAHNLLERARAMYSAELPPALLDAARALAPAALRAPLDALGRAMDTVRREARSQAPAAGDAQAGDAAILPTLPEPLSDSVRHAAGALAEHFAQVPGAAAAPGPLADAFFALLQFARLAEGFSDDSVLQCPAAPEAPLAIRNLLPAPFLRARFAAARAAVCFSGTLSPFEFYRDTLGMPARTAMLRVPSPFRAEQLDVRLATDVSTRWRDRARSLERVVDAIARQHAERPGNYLAFFGSFDYLEQALAALRRRHPAVAAWAQSRAMAEDARRAFLERFAEGGSGVGFAVLGGAFGEGVDLPGDRLIGAFVATLGMPRQDPLNEAIRARLDQRFDGRGHDYTYLYPGLQKVVQAAGRVIRTESDEGVVCLLDDRYTRPEVAALLPEWWRPRPWRAGAPVAAPGTRIWSRPATPALPAAPATPPAPASLSPDALPAP